MATPKPGEIRCPTCHRSTVPAAFCTQCGSPIPEDARARPRGMDRDELQDRIRQRRAPGDPYRRGGFAGDAPAGYERFEPDPQDTAAVRPDAEGAGAEGAQRVDYFQDRVESEPRPEFGSPLPPPDITHEPEPDRWEPRPSPRPEWDTPAPPPPAFAGTAPDEPSGWQRPGEEPAYVPPQYAPEYEDGYETDDDGYAYDDRWRPPERRGPSAGGLAILGFLALGVLALLGGAFVAGLFSDGDGVASDPTATPAVSVAPSEGATVVPTPSADASASVAASGSPGSQDGPVAFPDGAVFDVEPCATQGMSFDGCEVSAETTDAESVYAWVGFEAATGGDTLLLVLRSAGTGVADAQFALGDAPFNCGNDCNGYARQGFVGLTPGEYELELMRNGEFADRASFTVE